MRLKRTALAETSPSDIVAINHLVPEHYLLYLDVLGFSEMAATPNRVLNLYQIMDRLNVHAHKVFKSIVFSDTLLVYNVLQPRDANDRNYCVMYLLEFAQDLLYRLIGRNYYFRAILTKGEFLYHRFENLEAFFGQALIDAYRQEKDLIGVGLFLDNRLLLENTIFPTQQHCDRYHYVFLTQDVTSANDYGKAGFPFSGAILDSTATNFPTYAQFVFLADVYANAMEHPVPKVRAKFQATWVFYQVKFPDLCNVLQRSGFDLNAVADADSNAASVHFQNELSTEYYKFSASHAVGHAQKKQP